MTDNFNPIFKNIFDRVEADGDEIIAYIAYGIYKERKRDFVIRRQEELNGPVPPDEIDIFHKTYDEGQLDLIWSSATQSLATFAIYYAEIEKDAAVREALAEALRGRFWKQVWVNSASTVVFALGSIFVYFILRFVGFDLIDLFGKLESAFPS